jgi:hypothetical protein
MSIGSVIWFFAWIVVAQCCENKCVRAQGRAICHGNRPPLKDIVIEMWDDDGMYKKMNFFA